jgi:hypothetical protein
MSRLATLSRHPRRTLATLGTVLAAVGVTVASGADFTASSANPANTFSTGTLTMSNSKDNAAVFTASNLRPGDTAPDGIVDIANTGSLSGNFSLTRSQPSDNDAANPLSAKLNVVLDDCGAWVNGTAPDCSSVTNKYTGTLADMGTAGHAIGALGNFAGGEKHRYRFRVTLDTSVNNNYQGDNTSTTFTWNAA